MLKKDKYIRIKVSKAGDLSRVANILFDLRIVWITLTEYYKLIKQKESSK